MRTLIPFLFLVPSAAQADALRCGTDLVTVGASTYEVLQKCGEPVLTEVLREPIERVRSAVVVERETGLPQRVIEASATEPEYREVQRLTYVPEAGSFVRFVDIYNGRVIRITLGPRA